MLMNASIGLAPAGMTIKEGPSFAKLPIYNFDDQQSTGFPKDADALHEGGPRRPTAVLIVSPEYNWSVPARPEERHRLAVALQGQSRSRTSRWRSSRRPAVCSAARACSMHLRMVLAGRRCAAVLQARGDRQHRQRTKFADAQLTDQGAIDLIKQQLDAFAKFIERVKV